VAGGAPRGVADGLQAFMMAQIICVCSYTGGCACECSMAWRSILQQDMLAHCTAWHDTCSLHPTGGDC
jgi:hypothetical protein